MQNKYGALLVDPPWRFHDNSKPTDATRSTQRHYPLMTIRDIKALPIGDYCATDCAVFLWVLDTHLPEAIDTIKAWGLRFRTIAFNWVKTTSTGRLHMGCGWWTRAGSELCLLATKGRPRRLAANIRRVLLSPVREHSRKPDEVYSRIERLVAGPYGELFARTQWPGWDQLHSPEADKFIARSYIPHEQQTSSTHQDLPRLSP